MSPLVPPRFAQNVAVLSQTVNDAGRPEVERKNGMGARSGDLARRHLVDLAVAAGNIGREIDVTVGPLDRAAEADAVREDRRGEPDTAVPVEEHDTRLAVLEERHHECSVPRPPLRSGHERGARWREGEG